MCTIQSLKFNPYGHQRVRYREPHKCRKSTPGKTRATAHRPPNGNGTALFAPLCKPPRQPPENPLPNPKQSPRLKPSHKAAATSMVVTERWILPLHRPVCANRVFKICQMLKPRHPET